jgi:hypothetical protein
MQFERRPRAGLVFQTVVPLTLTCLLALVATPPLARASHDKGIHYGVGLVVNLPFPESEVEQVVQDVVQNGMIRGTKEYNKDEFVSGAAPATSTKVFSERVPGKVFYKVRLQALDPRNFKDSGDVGTLAVRYVLQAQGEKNTILRIDARFMEDFRRTAHESNGSVEGAEYKDIHDRLDAIEEIKSQTREAEQEKAEKEAAKAKTPPQPEHDAASEHELASNSSPSVSVTQPMVPPQVTTPQTTIAPVAQPQASVADSKTEAVSAPPTITASIPAETAPTPEGLTLEERVKNLRHQVERLVKSPGAPLKSAPFHTASTLQSLQSGTEVLVVVTTTYWLGVETHDGHHGWIQRDQLEELP